MHVAAIIDEERLAHERPMLDRLLVALINDDARITRVLPRESDAQPGPDDSRLGLTPRIHAPMRVLPWMRRQRIEAIVEAMSSALPDVIHVVGERAWGLALELAGEIDRPVTIDVWSSALVRRVPHGRAARHVGGYVAATQPIAQALRRRVGEELVWLVRPGVAAAKPRAERAARAATDTIALAIIGGGRDMPAYRAVLAALSRVMTQMPHVQAVLELRGPHEHEIWRVVQRLDLLGRVSSITDAALHRPLLTQCDFLLLPERVGEVQSLVLEAMALGMPVVASEDPALDMLIADGTAALVAGAKAAEWVQALQRLLSQPTEARELGERGRAHVLEHHRSSSQAAGLRRLFERIISGGAYRFKAATKL
jgi:hypothetical protein